MPRGAPRVGCIHAAFYRRAAIALILAVHCALLAYSAYVHSPVVSEVGHLPAGISHWQFGRFDLYRVNPPLVRMVAALPVMAIGAKTDWSHYDLNPLVRAETQVGTDFCNANGPRLFWLYTVGRWACIPFSLLGALVCYRWSKDLYGTAAGFSALCLWCFCPNVLGHGALMMPDIPAAAFGAAACYTFWRWLKAPIWWNTVTSGIVLGLAELVKTTLIVFYPLWPLLWIVYRWPERKAMNARAWLREGGMLIARMVIGLYVINLGYAFEGSFQRLGDFQFQSGALTGKWNTKGKPASVGNRFTDTWIGSVPVPLPSNYVQGIDAQKLDFERGMRSYLGGEWKEDGGWWYFYVYAAAIKVPLGTVALLLLAIILSLWRRDLSAHWRDEMLLVVPFVVIFGLVSSQTGFTIHFRYVFPAFAFAFIFASKLARLLPTAYSLRLPSLRLRSGSATAVFRCLLPAACCLLLCWSIMSSLAQYPHSISYFNEFVDKKSPGQAQLVDSNVAWGQDLLHLQSWMECHPEITRLDCLNLGLVNPSLVNDRLSALPPQAATGTMHGVSWCALDANALRGSHAPFATSDGGWTTICNQRWLQLLRTQKPVAVVGSFSIFRMNERAKGMTNEG